MGEATLTKSPALPVPDEPDDAALSALAGACVGRSANLRLLGSGWLRRDVAIAVSVRVAERSRQRGAICAMSRRGAVMALRRLGATNGEVAVALCAMGGPPSLSLLAWIAGMADADDVGQPATDEMGDDLLDGLLGAYLTNPWSSRILGTGWVRRDVAVALLVRIAVRTINKNRKDAVALLFAAQSMRKLCAARDEIAAALCAMDEPPSLTLLAWVARMARS